MISTASRVVSATAQSLQLFPVSGVTSENKADVAWVGLAADAGLRVPTYSTCVVLTYSLDRAGSGHPVTRTFSSVSAAFPVFHQLIVDGYFVSARAA